MYNAELAIRDFLLHKGVQLFWIDSAVGYIRMGLAGNSYLVSNVLTQRVTVVQGHVSSYTATVAAIYPDSKRKAVLQLRYRFNAKAKAGAKAHKVTLTVLQEEQA